MGDAFTCIFVPPPDLASEVSLLKVFFKLLSAVFFFSLHLFVIDQLHFTAIDHKDIFLVLMIIAELCPFGRHTYFGKISRCFCGPAKVCISHILMFGALLMSF